MSLFLIRHHTSRIFHHRIASCDPCAIIQQENLVKCLFQSLQGGAAVLGHQFAPPYDDCVPAEEAELDAFFYVALLVAFYLLLPELAIALWRYVVPAAFVSVPEAAVYKNYGLILPKDNVGCAGEPAHVYPVAVATRVQVTTHEHLGLGVFALDA